MELISDFLAIVLAFLVAISVHECAHAAAAYALGDPTAKFAGRLSLNPLRHLDPLGTILLFLVHFGWGKPVPVNPRNLARPLRDQALISLAGPLSNFVTAAILVIPMKHILPLFNGPVSDFVGTFLAFTISLNIVLMIFNLIPIPPLDGSKVLFLILGHKLANVSDWLETNGPIVLFSVIIFSNFLNIPVLQYVIAKPVDFVLTLLYLAG